MIAMYSIDANDDMVKSLQAERDAMKKSMNFLKDLFGLSTKQVDKIYNHVDSQTLNLYMSYVSAWSKVVRQNHLLILKGKLRKRNTQKNNR